MDEISEKIAKPQFDYSTLRIVARVAAEVLVDSRLRRIFSLRNGDLIFSFDPPDNRRGGFPCPHWIFSADPVLFGFYPWLTELPKKGETTHLAEMCDHHLGASKVVSVNVIDFERIVRIEFSRKDYTGEQRSMSFIAELMGKYSNLILVDSNELILAVHKPIHSYQSRYREVRAGKEYRFPPAQDRVTPMEFNPLEWSDFLASDEPGDNIGALINRTFKGMGLAWSDAICCMAEVEPKTKIAEITDPMRDALRNSFIQTLHIVQDGTPLSGEDREEFVGLIAEQYSRLLNLADVKGLKNKIGVVVKKRLKKLATLRSALEEDVEKADKAETYRRRADLILANVHLISKGANEITVEDWENPGESVKIAIDPHIPVNMQVEKLYTRYRKLKRTREIASHRRSAVLSEISELQDILNKIDESIEVAEIDSIREECIIRGLIDPNDSVDSKSRKRMKSATLPKIPARRYRSNDGFLILAGTSDKSNDALRRMCSGEDYWLHTRDIPGSHVFIISNGKEVPETTIKEAAMVAAWHSKAKDGSNVPVDYTRVKYVTAVPGGRPGKVTFKRERTIRVTPSAERIEMMGLMSGDNNGGNIGF